MKNFRGKCLPSLFCRFDGGFSCTLTTENLENCRIHLTLNARWQDSIHGVELVEQVELEPSTFLSILSRTSSDSPPKTKTFARIPQRFHISKQPASYVVQPLAAGGHETLKINDVAMSFRKISQRLSRKLEGKHFPNLSGE